LKQSGSLQLQPALCVDTTCVTDLHDTIEIVNTEGAVAGCDMRSITNVTGWLVR